MATFNSQVLIYGATFPGLVAARKLAAMGFTVNVIEWTNHVGGLTTGGLGKTDVVGQPGSANNTRWGLTLAFYKKISANPPYSNTDGSEVVNFSPSEAKLAMQQMLLDDTAHVTVKTGCLLSRVTKDPLTKKIASVTLTNGDVYTATIFLDCSYEGDLAAMAGVTMSIGRDSASKYRERIEYAPPDISKPGLNMEGATVDNFRSVDSNGNLYPWRSFGPSPWLPDGSPSIRSQGYGWRFSFSNLASRIAWPQPPGYRREDFLWVADMIANNGGAGSTFPLRISAFEVSIPTGQTHSGKFTTNGGDLIGFYTNPWPRASYAERIAIQNKAFWFAAGVTYFAANDTAVSQNYRNNLNTWGLPADEFTAASGDFIGTPGWPSAYYVRQARMMVGQYVMTTADAYPDSTGAANWHKPDPIAVGGYNIDAHNYYWCGLPDLTTLEEGRENYTQEKLYSIPLRSILPATGQCTNLIVPVCMSASTLLMNSIRMEPTWGVICESAGTLAGLALQAGVDVNAVPYSTLNARLVADGAVLAL